MDHLGVREHDGGVLAGPGAVVRWRVAVVGDRAQPGHQPAAERPQLVLRQRLGREDEECGVVGAAHGGVDDRQLVAERLARTRCRSRRRRAHAARMRSMRLGLVGVQRVDAPAREPGIDLRVEAVASGAVRAPSRREHGAVDDPLEELGRRRRWRRASRRRPARGRRSPAQHRAGVSGPPVGASVGLEDAVVAEVGEQARRARAEGEVAARAAHDRDQHVLHLRGIDREPEPAEAVQVLQPDAVELGVPTEVGEQVERPDRSGVRRRGTG